MDDPRTEVEQKERLLTELEARLHALGRIKKELSAQAQILRHQLLELKKSGHAGSPGHKERRTTSRRHGNLVSVTITREPSRVASAGVPAVDGWVMNRSGGGLCLLVDEEVAPGTVLTVTPHLGPDGIRMDSNRSEKLPAGKKELVVGLASSCKNSPEMTCGRLGSSVFFRNRNR
jgi:hypothetical protein